MRAAGRYGLIVLCLVLTSVPAGALCEAAGDWLARCHAAPNDSAHTMADCGDEPSVTSGCCDSDSLDATTDLVLKRPGDEDAGTGDIGRRSAVDGPLDERSTLRLTGAGPPPRPPRDRLTSILLL